MTILEKIKGKNEKQILKEHGKQYCCEVIHRDSLVVFNENDYELIKFFIKKNNFLIKEKK